MTRAVELLRQGNLGEFMDIQRRLLVEQLELLNGCPLCEKIMRGTKPRTLEEFREQVPLTTYADYCPDFLEKSEDLLPIKPESWMRTSGKSGEYSCKWVPLSPEYSREMSAILYGLGILSSCRGWGDTSGMNNCPRIIYTVAPRPYTSGIMAAMIEQQTPSRYLPPMDEAEKLAFEDRVKVGFRQALSQGLDFFFGLSLVLVTVGNHFSEPPDKAVILSLLSRPKALLRLAKGMIKSKLARRPMLPKDLWSVKGIICSGLDSWVYREKIHELWGKYPLDLYAGTEIGVVATQVWDCGSMSFIPNLNFLEFIPEAEHFKWQLDHSYQPKTILLDEVKAGENYEIVITNFHGGAMIRYRPGDMVGITSLRNEKLGIEIPQMVFLRRADDLIDFGVTRLTEKVIWQAIEDTGIPYEDWIAVKEVKESMTLHLYIEPKDGYHASESDLERAFSEQLKVLDSSFVATHNDVGSYLDFSTKVTLLPNGAFSRYISQRRAEGAELAHLKPPHVNPSDEILSLLLAEPEEIIVVTKAKTKAETEDEKIAV